MNVISTANIPMSPHHAFGKTPGIQAKLAAFLTADDDWIAHNQGKTMALVLTAAMVLPGVIEWMI